MNIYYLLIVTLAIWGIYITVKIHITKSSNRPLVCPLGADCHGVLHSEFSSFLGIGLEIFGALYYTFIALSYGIILAVPQLANLYVIFILTGFTLGAFLFSLYLTFVQAFYIKSWCTWCLTSAGISTLILFLTLFTVINAGITFVPILEMFEPAILAMHLLGFALGVGGATIADVLYMKFLKDLHISEDEDKILKVMSQIIWVGLSLIVISGIGLYLPNAETLNESSKFLIKMTVVAIIIINGAFLNLYISPKLVSKKIPGSVDAWDLKAINVIETHKLRKLSFALGSVSFVSWYTAFILGSLRSVPLSYIELLSIYLVLIILAMAVSQIMERFYCLKSSTKKIERAII